MIIIERVLRDCRHAIRLLAKTPGFTAAAVTTLGLGIGANTAMFTLIKAVLIEPLPYRDPGSLVVIWNSEDRRGTTHLSLREIVAFGDDAKSFEEMAGYAETNVNLTGEEDPERVRAGVVTANLFDTLGVQPMLGRTFTGEEGQPGSAAVAILSQGLWERRFGGAADLIGRSIRVNGRPRTVVGIMPESFRLPLDYRADRPTEVWLPLVIDRANLGAWGSRSYFGVGRLKSGLVPAHASSELAVITGRWVQAGFDGFRGGVLRRDALPVQQLITGGVRTSLLILVGAVAAVLLIACANVVNLLLARADVRRHEIAIRAAIGATRRQLVGQLFTEAALLSLLGGACGLAIAHAALRLLVLLRPANVPRVDEVALDPAVLAFTAAISMASAVVSGTAPALQLARPHLSGVLGEGGRTGSPGRGRRKARRVLVIVQIAFSVVLVIGAGLLVRTLIELYRVDLGFDPRNVLTAQLQLSQTDYPTDESVVAFYQQLTERVRQLPGVENAGAVRVIPLARTIGDYSITIEGRTKAPGENANGDFQWVTPGYFGAMGMTLLRGRWLTDEDRESAPLVVVINETMAARYWPGQDALGKRFHMGGSTERPPLTIVGIVSPTRHNAVVEPVRAEMFLPHAQLSRSVGGTARTMALIVRTAGDPVHMVGPLRDVVHTLDRNLPLADIRTMEEITAAALSVPRFAALLLGLFAVLALSLAAVGLYATISLLVAERSREIGIRMALGAARRSVLGLVFQEGLILTASGLTVGLTGASILSRSLETLLYGVQRFDAATFVTVPAILVVVALAACLDPARRAASVDPVVTLRQG
jgi:putative ABC transport system permease protein